MSTHASDTCRSEHHGLVWCAHFRQHLLWSGRATQVLSLCVGMDGIRRSAIDAGCNWQSLGGFDNKPDVGLALETLHTMSGQAPGDVHTGLAGDINMMPLENSCPGVNVFADVVFARHSQTRGISCKAWACAGKLFSRLHAGLVILQAGVCCFVSFGECERVAVPRNGAVNHRIHS